MSLRESFEQNKDRRYIMFGGKGGLGKTTFSAATAYWLARQGHRVLVFSVDPQASLSDTFQRDIFGKGAVKIMENLWAQEIDADSHIKAYQQEVRQKILDMYGMERIPDEIEDYIQAASAEPAMEESAIFDAVVDIVVKGDYDYYIYDLVPLGHALYYLSMAKVYDEWINRITQLREQMREHEEMVARIRRQKVTEEDQILSELQYIKGRINQSSRILTDKERTAFFFVVVPEQMIILDTEKAAQLFARFDVPIAGYIVNRILPAELAGQDAVHDVAGDGHVEPGEQLRGLLCVQDDHLLGYEDEEKGGALLVGQDAGGLVDASLDVLELVEDLVFLGDLLALDARDHLFVLAHLLPELRDPVDPLVVDFGHRQVVERVAERHQVIDVVVVVALHHDVHDRVEDGRFLHGRLGRGRLDVMLDFFRDLIESVHVEDLLADLLLIRLDIGVGVDLLRPKVVQDLDRALAEDVTLEDVAEGRLGVHGKHQHLVPLPRQPVGGRGRKRRLAQAALAAEHDVAALAVLLEPCSQRHREGTGSRVGGSKHRIGNVFLPEHAPLPGGDIGDDVRQQAQRIVWRENRDADQVAHRDQDEEVLHAGPGAQGVARHIVRAHPVENLLQPGEQATLLLLRHGSRSPSPRARIRPSDP